MKKPVVSLRKPPSSLDAFVSAEVPSFPSPQVPSPPSSQVLRAAKGEHRRADGRTVHRMTVYLEPNIARRLRVHCAETGREISDVAGEAIEKLLGA